VKLRAELDWTPGGTPEMPYALMVSRCQEVEVTAGFQARSGITVLLISVDDSEPIPYDRLPGGSEFSMLPYQLSYWVESAMNLMPGETGKAKNRQVTRLTDAEIRALDPIKITSHNYH
jgi:hypothetical protein